MYGRQVQRHSAMTGSRQVVSPAVTAALIAASLRFDEIDVASSLTL